MLISKIFKDLEFRRKPTRNSGLALFVPGEPLVRTGLVATHEGVLEVLRDPGAHLLAGGVLLDEGHQLDHGEDQTDDQEDQEEQEGPVWKRTVERFENGVENHVEHTFPIQLLVELLNKQRSLNYDFA